MFHHEDTPIPDQLERLDENLNDLKEKYVLLTSFVNKLEEELKEELKSSKVEEYAWKMLEKLYDEELRGGIAFDDFEADIASIVKMAKRFIDEVENNG